MLQTYIRALLSPQGDLEDFSAWRDRILSLLLICTLVLGSLVAVPSILVALSVGLWSVALVDAIALGWGLTIWLKRSLSFRARAWNYCVILYFLGLALLVTAGVASQTYLIAFPVMTALLLGFRPALFALALNAVTLPAIGYSFNGDLHIKGLNPQPFLEWMVITVNFTFVSAMLTISIVVLLNGLEKALAKRRDSERRYRTLIEWTPEPLAVHDGERFVYVNPAAVELFGATSAQDLVGKSIYDVIHPDSQKIVQGRLNIHRQQAGTLPSREQKLLKIDGSTIIAEVRSARITFDGKDAIQIALHDITERKAAQDQVQQLVFSDPLTGLSNRRFLMERLKQALTATIRRQRLGALVFVDLDNFKTFNETQGQEQGDHYLQHVTERLRHCIREGDTVARFGGDEFVVLLEELNGNPQDAATQAETIGEKILRSLSQPYEFGSSEHHGTASIGITLFGDEHGSTSDPLMQAELAMYQAKAAGRNVLRFFDPQMQAAVSRRAALEAALREALSKNQFFLEYQVQVTDTGQAVGVEALVRWHDPLRGRVSPAEFISLAEETGLILPLGYWVLETACRQLALWASRTEMANLTVAVNVSAVQFHQKDFVAQTLAVLERTGANPYRLKLELTESLLVTEVEEVIAKMNALKGKGVGFALDDFGTGYSSLSILKRLPLDQLKIDQGFVRDILIDPNDAAIAGMVVALADKMGLTVIAEGVETVAQRELLADFGCHHYQGYLFSRPLPIDEFESFAARP